MKKLLKRLLVFCTAASLAMCCVPALADETDYKGTLSGYMRTFSESADVGSYIDVIGDEASANYQSLYDDEGNTVLKLGNESNEPARLYNSGGSVWSGESTAGVKLEFKVRRIDSRAEGAFCVYGDNKDVYFMMKGKKVYLLGANVSSYEENVWYDVRLNLDFSVGYVELSIKKSKESEWITVSTAGAETYNILANITKDWKKMPSAITTVMFSHYRNTASDRTITYIDDLVVDSWSNDVGYRDFLEDDFTSGANTVSESAQPMVDSMANWLLDDGAEVSASGVATLSVSTGNESVGIYKKPFYSASAVRQRFRFKLSAPTSGTAKVSLGFNDGTTQKTYLELSNAQRMSLLEIESDKIILGDKQHAVSLSADTLYDCEIVYEADEKIAKIALTDSDGHQYAGSANAGLSAVFGEDSDWGYLSEFALALTPDSESAASVYFDDFDWDIGLNSYSSGTLLNGQNSDDAPLDPTICFTYGETIDPALAIGTGNANPGSAKLEVLEEGTEVTVPYTLEWVPAGINCTLMGLSTDKNYTVTLTGVTLLSEDEADGVSLSFKTTTAEVTAAEPEFSNGVVSVDVSTGYAAGKLLTFMALEYDDRGALIGAKVLERAVGTITETLTISGIGDCSKIGVMLWSDFVTQEPHTRVKMFDVVK